ncbi:MAG: hypothetical protein J5I41_11120 [Saprospiraceae bacterium]|nr:hypothetical protein [Saprospiraceae bacterium]
MLIDQISRLAAEKGAPCITISLNTHRTHPDNLQDAITLKNLVKEAESRVLASYDKRAVQPLLQRLQSVPDKVDANRNLDSLHLFLSNDTEEVVRSPFRTTDARIQIHEHFAVRPLIKAYTRTQSYLIMVLGQAGVQLYEAENDAIQTEIRNGDFPFGENTNVITDREKRSDAKKLDEMVREYFNVVDKALVKVVNETGLPCVVVSTQDNWDRLQQVADRPAVYQGHVAIDYNHMAPHQIAEDTYSFMRLQMSQQRARLIEEVRYAVGQSKVITDLNEIYRAALEGRGDLLLVHEDYAQPVLMQGETEFTPVDDPQQNGVVDDIVSDIAWNVLLRKGRVVFTRQEGLQDFGRIALKVRY